MLLEPHSRLRRRCGQRAHLVLPDPRYHPTINGDSVERVLREFHRSRVWCLASESVRFRDLDVQVVTPHQLFEMKRATVRLRDRADAELLRERFGLDGTED